MREIKFRAWDNLAGYARMIYDGFSIVASGDPVGFFVEPDITPNTTRICGEWRGDSTIIIMQYTGLKDKNGKEIYEGDIVYARLNKGTYQVKWGQYKCPNDDMADDVHQGPYVEDLRSGYVEAPGERDSCNLEVIGNIYENPELLKEA